MRIQTGNNQNALLVPQSAVMEVQSMYQLIVLTSENKAMFRPVKVGERVGPNWIITEGLKPGERVVVEGILKLQLFAARAPEVAWRRHPVVPKPYVGAAAERRPELCRNSLLIGPSSSIVIAILMVLVGVVAMLGLPTRLAVSPTLLTL